MTVKRLDNVGIVVADLDAAIEFFVELGSRSKVVRRFAGEWADGVTGLRGMRCEIAMLRTPDGHGRLELSRFDAPRPSPNIARRRSTRSGISASCSRYEPRRRARSAAAAWCDGRRSSSELPEHLSPLLRSWARGNFDRARRRSRAANFASRSAVEMSKVRLERSPHATSCGNMASCNRSVTLSTSRSTVAAIIKRESRPTPSRIATG